MFPFMDLKNNGRSFSDDAMTDLSPLLDMLGGLEDAAARAHEAAMKDPATVKASGAAFAAFANVCGAFPELRVRTRAGASRPPSMSARSH